MNELRPGRATCTCGHPLHATRLIAVTGGPGGGKSAVVELATRLFCEEAAELDAKIEAAWAGHPRRFFVDNRDDFMDKAHEALDVLRSQLPPCCGNHPLI